MSQKSIESILPHRYPMLLIDRVISRDKKKIIATKNVTHNEWYFQGHFPGEPIVPGVLIVETMAQAAGLLSENAKSMYFMSIDSAKFRQKVVPGDVMVCHIELIKEKIMKDSKVCVFSGVVYVEDKKVAECKFTAIVS
jgi:beta-hydroxyacyl-ACP dehydratase FabZ